MVAKPSLFNLLSMTSVTEQFSLNGKNILITGGGGFLAGYFAQAVSELGGFPILLDLNNESLIKSSALLKSQGFSSDSFELNLKDKFQIRETISNISNKYSSIDVLINGAAFAMKNMKEAEKNYFANFEDYDDELWQVALDINLTGTFLITQCVGSLMKMQGRGSIVNIASDVGIISPDHRIYEPDEERDYKGVSFNTPISYSVTKAGILSFTRFLATYWAKDGIRVNSLSPAGVFRNQDPKFIEQLVYRIPLGRMAKPEELKGPIAFLCSDASSFITGSNLVVDGGRTIW